MSTHVINDVTGLNPVPVWSIVVPTTVEEVCDAVRRTTGPISIGGGRFSMGGQIASPGSLHLDMRTLNQVVRFAPIERTIRVQAGIRWCDIQRFADPHGLAVKIMQTYANFTVGGSLSVNVHGRYMGLGPVILSVRAISIVLANGARVEASPNERSDIFYGAIGGYGGLGVIVEVELDLVENIRVERQSVKLVVPKYLEHFRQTARTSRDAIYHNADLYPPHFTRARAVTWVRTDKPATAPQRLQTVTRSYPLHRYFFWAITETPFGKWRREYIVDPLFFFSRKVHWRNYEAGYDVAELEPASRKRSTYVLQEYFVPIERFEAFVPKMAEILRRHRVNAVNVSVRHALADPGSYLAWARKETFAFVLYHKQRVRDNAKNRVAVWTRELIDAVISEDGAYYLPYQVHATPEQFHRAYPRARELFALKAELDPQFRFRNAIWDTYYAPTLAPMNASDRTPTARPAGEFHTVFNDVGMHDGFYRFLQNVYRIYPEDRFHTLIKEACKAQSTDEAVYRQIQAKLPSIKPFLAELFYALPALKKQKQEMARQTLELLGEQRRVDGYAEIGTTGRYISHLRKHLQMAGPIYLINDVAPTNSPVDIVERGQLGQIGGFVPLENYLPIPAGAIPDASLELVTCYIGLHHVPLDRLDAFVCSVVRVLRPGGRFVLRDHDVKTPAMQAFVSLAHTVFNAGLNLSWETNQAELRAFQSIEFWIQYLGARGLRDSGRRLLQAHDPTDNTLLGFVKA
jgi:FAD/FMN-containing dehydrogenase/SAM-dependent methyltransferase